MSVCVYVNFHLFHLFYMFGRTNKHKKKIEILFWNNKKGWFLIYTIRHLIYIYIYNFVISRVSYKIIKKEQKKKMHLGNLCKRFVNILSIINVSIIEHNFYPLDVNVLAFVRRSRRLAVTSFKIKLKAITICKNIHFYVNKL